MVDTKGNQSSLLTRNRNKGQAVSQVTAAHKIRPCSTRMHRKFEVPISHLIQLKEESNSILMDEADRKSSMRGNICLLLNGMSNVYLVSLKSNAGDVSNMLGADKPHLQHVRIQLG